MKRSPTPPVGSVKPNPNRKPTASLGEGSTFRYHNYGQSIKSDLSEFFTESEVVTEMKVYSEPEHWRTLRPSARAEIVQQFCAVLSSTNPTECTQLGQVDAALHRLCFLSVGGGYGSLSSETEWEDKVVENNTFLYNNGILLPLLTFCCMLLSWFFQPARTQNAELEKDIANTQSKRLRVSLNSLYCLLCCTCRTATLLQPLNDFVFQGMDVCSFLLLALGNTVGYYSQNIGCQLIPLKKLTLLLHKCLLNSVLPRPSELHIPTTLSSLTIDRLKNCTNNTRKLSPKACPEDVVRYINCVVSSQVQAVKHLDEAALLSYYYSCYSSDHSSFQSYKQETVAVAGQPTWEEMSIPFPIREALQTFAKMHQTQFKEFQHNQHSQVVGQHHRHRSSSPNDQHDIDPTAQQCQQDNTPLVAAKVMEFHLLQRYHDFREAQAKARASSQGLDVGPTPVSDPNDVYCSHARWPGEELNLRRVNQQVSCIPRALWNEVSLAEKVYRHTVCNLAMISSAFSKLLLVGSCTDQQGTDLDFMKEIYPNGLKASGRNADDEHDKNYIVEEMKRHKEIIISVVTNVLILLVRMFQRNHQLQYEYFKLCFIEQKGLLLLLKLLSTSRLIEDSINTSVPTVRTSGIETATITHQEYINSPVSLFVQIQQSCCNVTPESCNNVYISCVRVVERPEVVTTKHIVNRRLINIINCLILAHKMTKRNINRVEVLMRYKMQVCLRKILALQQEHVSVYCLKLFKTMLRCLGRRWKQSNMIVLSTMYNYIKQDIADVYLHVETPVELTEPASLPAMPPGWTTDNTLIMKTKAFNQDEYFRRWVQPADQDEQ